VCFLVEGIMQPHKLLHSRALTNLYDVSALKIGDLKLHSLLLRSCEVGSTGINSLCATQSTLTELDISCCPRITDTALSSICSLLPNLQKLSLRNCHAVTDTGLSCISQLSGLKEINLQGLRNITSFGKKLYANILHYIKHIFKSLMM
jgi:hypothetical protein